MNEEFNTFGQVLDYAIDREINSRLYYLSLAQKATSSKLEALLIRLADEEFQHQKKLARIKQGPVKILQGDSPIVDLGIADCLPETVPHPDMSFTEALQVAMLKEKFTYRLYHELALTAPTEDIMELFLGLAHEEANHKVSLEILYDDHLQEDSSDQR